MERGRIRSRELIADGNASGGFSHCRHSRGIASKLGNVLLDPLESNLLVCKAKVAATLVAVLFELVFDSLAGEESADPNSVVEIYVDDWRTHRDTAGDQVDAVKDGKIGATIQK
jgi:hypothetical protein